MYHRRNFIKFNDKHNKISIIAINNFNDFLFEKLLCNVISKKSLLVDRY